MRTCLGVLGAFFGLSCCAFGSISNCVTAGQGSAISTYGSGLGNGCSSVDLSFENLTVSSPVASGSGFATEDATNNAIFASGTAASGNTVGPVSAFLDPLAAANWVLSAGNTTGSTGATVSYVAIAHTGGTGYGSGPTTPGLIWAFNGLALNTTGSGGKGTSTVIMTFCAGATSTTIGSGGCTAGNEGTITASYASGASTPTFTCTYSGCVSGTSNTIDFLSSFTQIAISDTYLINKTSNGTGITLTDFENQFSQSAVAPEPSTWAMVGLGLVGLVLFSRRAGRPQKTIRLRTSGACPTR